MRILHVVGARPNFMKAAPVLRALAEFPEAEQILVHTGQHYDAAMSDIFFRQLEIPEPDFNLGVGSGSHSEQVARVMLAFEPIVLDQMPDLVLVYGDVNSTVAACLVCAKVGVRLGHVEAGLRSGDRTMPEEINRILTDQLADFLFTPSSDGDENLVREGVERSKIYCVGNVMIDTLVRLLPRAEKEFPPTIRLPYALVTLHRPSNVDDLLWLRELLAALVDLSHELSVVFPVHPRTRKALNAIGAKNNGHLCLRDPLPYLEFLALQRHAALVITDSGGIQEEAAFLGIPCLTVRENTERPITITHGTNQLVGRDLMRLRKAASEILGGNTAATQITSARIPLWDGHAAERIARIVTSDACHEAKIVGALKAGRWRRN